MSPLSFFVWTLLVAIAFVIGIITGWFARKDFEK